MRPVVLGLLGTACNTAQCGQASLCVRTDIVEWMPKRFYPPVCASPLPSTPCGCASDPAGRCLLALLRHPTCIFAAHPMQTVLTLMLPQAYPEFCRQLVTSLAPSPHLHSRLLKLCKLFHPCRRPTPSSAGRCSTPRPRASKSRWPSCRPSMARRVRC